MSARLSTHVLDLVRGGPAPGMRIDLVDDTGAIVKTAMTNADGRTEAPMLGPDEMREGVFELRFHVAAYFGVAEGFLEIVPVRFRITDAAQSYHVPLLCTPWSYSTYRGS
ncbi:MAG TPA: hydroxyisourate hydrolase [Chthoniobacterales bacterium]|jgi:5-hydroxyisourate hydrolase